MKKPWDAILWWEIRRIPYNVALLLAGIIAASVIFFIGSHYLQQGEDLEEPLGVIIGAIGYVAAANVCYTFGWITEILWSGGDTVRTQPYRTRLFLIGLIFSILVTLSFAIVVPLAWLTLGFHH